MANFVQKGCGSKFYTDVTKVRQAGNVLTMTDNGNGTYKLKAIKPFQFLGFAMSDTTPEEFVLLDTANQQTYAGLLLELLYAMDIANSVASADFDAGVGVNYVASRRFAQYFLRYLGTPENAAFYKNSILYGANMARNFWNNSAPVAVDLYKDFNDLAKRVYDNQQKILFAAPGEYNISAGFPLSVQPVRFEFPFYVAPEVALLDVYQSGWFNGDAPGDVVDILQGYMWVERVSDGQVVAGSKTIPLPQIVPGTLLTDSATLATAVIQCVGSATGDGPTPPMPNINKYDAAIEWQGGVPNCTTFTLSVGEDYTWGFLGLPTGGGTDPTRTFVLRFAIAYLPGQSAVGTTLAAYIAALGLPNIFTTELDSDATNDKEL